MKKSIVFLLSFLVSQAHLYAGCPGAHGAGSAPAVAVEELQTAIRSAGFPATAVATMVCIAQEESGRYPEAYCADADDEILAFGTFQIYKLWFEECSGYTDLDSQLSVLADVRSNAKCAYRAYRTAKAQTGLGYNAWDVYKQGKCRGL